MSVGDIKGSRRRMKILRALGHFPPKRGLSVSESIDRNRRIAARMAKSAGAKK